MKLVFVAVLLAVTQHVATCWQQIQPYHPTRVHQHSRNLQRYQHHLYHRFDDSNEGGGHSWSRQRRQQQVGMSNIDIDVSRMHVTRPFPLALDTYHYRRILCGTSSYEKDLLRDDQRDESIFLRKQGHERQPHHHDEQLSMGAPAPARVGSLPGSRRDAVKMTLAALLTGSTFGSRCIAAVDQPTVMTQTVVPQECQNGALVAESAVPGAYDQICMNLPLRSIPIYSVNRDGEFRSITLSLEQGGTGAGKTGLAVWNSSLLLARLVQALAQQQATWLVDKSVVEVGCGAGLVSLVAAHNGAPSVWATDGNQDAVLLTQRNVQRNPISTDKNNSVVTASVLPWGELEVPLDAMGQADVILGSDLTYNSGSWRVLAETMEGLIKPKTGVILYLSVGHSGFNARGELDGFASVAQQLGLSVWKNDSQSLLPKFPPGIASFDQWLQLLVTPPEKAILAATGGAQILVLYKK